MGAAMSNEMDQSDSWFESFEEEIASMTPQQQEPIPNPRPLPPEPPLMPTWLPILVYGPPSTVDIGPACWDWATPPVGIGPHCWDPIPLHVMLNEMDQSDSSSESSVTPQQQQQPIPLHAMLIEIDQSDPSFESFVTLQQQQLIPNPRPPPATPPPPPAPPPPAVRPPLFLFPKTEHVISRVVHTIRDIEPDVYTPKFVSIGPFHHGNERLQDMQKRKQVLFDRFEETCGVNLDVLSNCIEDLVPKVRDFYSEDIKPSNGDLVELILKDAVFIIEIFLSLPDEQKEIPAADSIPSLLAILGTLPLDLVLFENQLPFFVLKKIFDIAFSGRSALTFPKLACKYFSMAFGLKMPEHYHDNDGSIKHFTDLVRFLFLQGAPPPRMEPYLWNTSKLRYSAKKLQELGVKFKVSKSKSILDIRFSDPILELPELWVADSMTDALFRNMVAFEQLHCSSASYITNYVTLWSDLINTTEDVHVLVDKEIIRNFMPDTEVVTLFKSMGRIGFQAAMIHEYIDIFQRLNAFCENRCHRNIASLRRDYCRTPWQVVASIAGGCLLILTLLQTIFTIKK